MTSSDNDVNSGYIVGIYLTILLINVIFFVHTYVVQNI